MANIQSFLQNDFSGGMNSNDNPSSLNDNEFIDGQNNRIDERGIARKRYGYTPINLEGTTSSIRGLVSYFGTNSSQEHILKCINDTWVEYNGSIWTSAFAGSTTATTKESHSVSFNAPTEEVITSGSGVVKTATINTIVISGGGYSTNSLQDKILYVTSATNSGENKIITSNEKDSSSDDEITVYGKWDNIPSVGSSVEIREVSPQSLIYNGSDTPFKVKPLTATTSDRTNLDIPNFEFAIEYQNRLFGFLKGTSKLQFSDISNFESFPKNNYIDVDKGNGTLQSLGITSLGLAIYKDKKTFVLLGDTTDNYRIRERDRKHGCIAPRATQSYNGLSYTLDQDGIYQFDGQYNKLISRKVNDKLLTNLPLMVKAKAHIFDDKYYLSYPSESSSTGNDRQAVFDFRYNAWAGVDTYGINNYVRYDDHMHGTKDDITEVFRLEDDTCHNDDGLSINWKLDTKEWDLGSLGRMKKNKKLFVECKAITTSTLLVIKSEVDNEGFDNVGNLDLGTAGSLWDNFIWDVDDWSGADNVIDRFRVGQKGRNIKFRFSNNSTNEVELYKYENSFKVRKIK